MTALIFGILWGITSALIPGPTLTLVISRTLQFNYKEGIKIAFAPLVFGIVIIPLSLLIINQLKQFHTILAMICFIGAAYISYLSYGLITTSRKIDLAQAPPSARAGILVNFASPTGYMFWLNVGAPFMVRSLDESLILLIAFLVGYYVFLVGIKIIIALMVHHTKKVIDDKFFSYALKILGVVLLYFAVSFINQGVILLHS